MSLSKAILIVLLLLRVLPRLDSYHYRSHQPSNWHYLTNLYGDAGGELTGGYDRLVGSVSETGTGSGGGGTGTGSDCGGGGVGGGGVGGGGVGGGGVGDGEGSGGAGAGSGSGSGSGSGGSGGSGGGSVSSTDVGRGCGKQSSRCGSSLGRGDPKQTASAFAQRAALDAKAASDAQMAAAEAASYQVKCELAAKAIQSAKAAEAVLAGKQQVLDQLRLEVTEAEAEVAGLTLPLRSIQENAEAAAMTVQETQAQLSHLKNILQSATANLANIQNVSKGAQLELAEKTQILKAAQHRADNLSRQLSEAKADFEKTKVAAYKAVCAAVEAKQKAQRNRRMSWLYLDPQEQL